ncbi:hypothetical protein DID88_005200 [Monilinia fructigena]|uniref:Uncharacterized protein n=1 Tax=Monilinia fructigena TaxID=38457 RepID=A0A395IE81_9HELO|nr:hypothetical protein DID88_005200 [Monilinia fructigena]
MATNIKPIPLQLDNQPSTAITQAILGQFAGTKEQQIVTASGSRLTLHRPDPSQGKIVTALSHDVFGIIRAIAAFRLAGSNKDYIIITSDSGRITIVEFVPAQNKFNAYISRLSETLDVGYANPVFAALEVDYGDSDQDPTGQAYEEIEKQLVYYELDLGLNHVVRKWSDPVDRTANILFQVPGGTDGPSGVWSPNLTDEDAPQIYSIVATGARSTFRTLKTRFGAEYDEKKEMSGTVTCLSLGEVPEGRQRSQFLAVGCDDSTVRILSLDPESTLENKSVQALTSPPSALSIMAMSDSSSGGSTLYLHIGLYSGVYLRTVLDEVTGELSIHEHVSLVQSQPSFQSICSRPCYQGFMLTPLNYPALEWGWNFSSEQCTEGMVGIQGQNLRIFSIEKLTNNLLQESIPLTYTPRRFVRHPEHPCFYVIEADNNILSPATKQSYLRILPL